MPLLNAQQLSKAYGPRIILEGINLTIEQGERLGLVGINGCGKSTLARILAGLEEPDSGTVVRQRGLRVAYLAQTPSFPAQHTAREEVLAGLIEWSAAKARYEQITTALGSTCDPLPEMLAAQAQAAAEVERLGGWELEHRAAAIMGHLRLPDGQARLGTLSGGEQRRVALAKILVAQPDLALLDEPTNHLDVETIEWLEQYLLQSWRGALLLVTHDRYVLDRVAQRTLELERGQLVSYPGSYERYLELKAERLALEERSESQRQNFLRHELAWLRRQPKARTGKQKARIQRAETALHDAPPVHQRQVALRLESKRSGKSILQLEALQIAPFGHLLVQQLDLILTKGQRVGIVGPNGCGKTTLLRTIVGELEPAAGRVLCGQNVALSYLGQSRAGLDDDKTILQNISDGQRQVVVGEKPLEVQSYLGRFLFSTAALEQKVGALSGGERTRVALAKLLLQSTNLLVLDEPANDLDVPTLAALEQMLIEFSGTALVVTHDRWFLDRVATDILAFEGTGRVVLYAGNYSIYRALSSAREAAEAAAAQALRAPATSAGEKASRRSERKPRSLTYAERLELAGIMEQIEAAEQRVSTLEEQLADPATYRERAGEIPALMATLRTAQESVTRLLARWEELETKSLTDHS